MAAHPRRLSFHPARVLPWLIVGLGLSAPMSASAQQDVEPILPNVMLLLDTSGSMERMISGAYPELSGATCDTTTNSTPNRWGTLIEALTGQVVQNGGSVGYRCVSLPRTPGTQFTNEFSIGGVYPQDTNYHLPYHRPVSTGDGGKVCVYAPGKLPDPGGTGVGLVAPWGPSNVNAALDSFPSDGIVTRVHSAPGTACEFLQLPNGVLDSYHSLMRFGLMTFDTDPAEAKGTVGSPPTTVDVSAVTGAPFLGTWSYFAGWDTGAASPKIGWPADCATNITLEIGARNPAAPPWEGRMMRLPAWNATAAENETAATNIQKVVLATRPYGATPIAAMLDDAKHYFWSDTKGPQATDSFVQQGCRNEFIILLTDGAPNLDMRPECEKTGTPTTGRDGTCPYVKSETTAAELAAGGTGKQKVKTFVLGFAVSSLDDSGTLVNCSSLVSNGTLSATCSDPTKQDLYGPCCTLHKIAMNGGTEKAYFADTPADLNAALGAILATISRQITTRTTPTYAPVATAVPTITDPNALPTAAATYLSSFVPSPGKPWSGNIQRQQQKCSDNSSGSYTFATPSVDAAAGDDFSANLNCAATGTCSGASPARTFVAYETGAAVDSQTTIRPNIGATVSDGLPKSTATRVIGDSNAVIAGLTVNSLGINATSCPNMLNNQWLTADECKKLALSFLFATQTGPAIPNNTFLPFQSRWGNAFADIYHASPAIAPRPSALTRDEGYQKYAIAKQARKTVLYAATNDGLLHAFWTDVTTRANNELWAFVPPAVMKRVLPTYPSRHEFLLDGSPTIKDVVTERAAGDITSDLVWRTALVAGFGPQAAGYYALDITDPEYDPTKPTTGPKLLWQLTNTDATTGEQKLFGKKGATPAITTVYIDVGGTKKEVGVAILPGGIDGTAVAPAGGNPGCERALKTTDSSHPTLYRPRTHVRCWGGTGAATDPVVGRSVTIVRLDTGEILRVFGRKADFLPDTTKIYSTKLNDTPLDSPMIGRAIAYPNAVGSVAQKAFVSDADGTVWKFDLTATNPASWTGELFFDAYNPDTYPATFTVPGWSAGQPIELAPTLSVGRDGALVLHVATGDQDSFQPGGTNFVWSLTEKQQTHAGVTKLRSSPNWYWRSDDNTGERVTGPMSVFDSVLYFATYLPVQSGSAVVCGGGTSKIFGRDYTQPQDPTDLSKGGVHKLNPAGASPVPAYIVPSDTNAALLGKVIPGVSVNVTPACPVAGASTSDPYVSGSTHQAMSAFTQGRYQLTAQVGAPKTGGAGTVETFTQNLETPSFLTVVDSWAVVTE